jgi:hypothetical protein
VRHRRLVVVAAAVWVLAPGSAFAGGHAPKPPSSPVTYDVSYPQCGGALPGNADSGIVGVNDGIVFSANPCLATEWTWATHATGHAPAFYANTGDPGPAYSSHWPAGQQAPQVCDGSNSTACAYDYGWNAAKDSFADAAKVTSAPASYGWWLDVETGNSWETLESAYGQTAVAQAADRAELSGEIAALRDAGVSTVGVYSTAYQWRQVTGGTGTQFAASSAWVAGTGSLATAAANCGSASFTGGPVVLTQYARSGYDADDRC